MNRTHQAKATKKASEELLGLFPKVAALPRDPRGIPIPANVSTDPVNGRPVFAAIDLMKEIDLLCDGKCAVTGSNLEVDDVWFISTSDLVFHPFGLCLDAPICGQAKDFALQVCPYLAVRNYQALSKKQKDAMTRDREGVDPIATFIRPSTFAAVRVKGFYAEPTKAGMRYLPSRQYTYVEFWKDGKREKVAAGAEIALLMAEYQEAAAQRHGKETWPGWVHASIGGNLNGVWPWKIEGVKCLFHEAAKEVLAK